MLWVHSIAVCCKVLRGWKVFWDKTAVTSSHPMHDAVLSHCSAVLPMRRMQHVNYFTLRQAHVVGSRAGYD